ncbi:hypothetical protein H7X68_03030 [Candidatus Saccharibacteria bacterium]|nr:hypothetical protein [Candidatus Saccharibacteria bacterium]
MNKRNKILIIIGLIFIGIVAWSVIYMITPRSTILLALAPEEGLMSIDEGSPRTVNNKQSLDVSPGKHKIKFFRDGFSSYSKDITIANKQTLEVVIALNGLTDDASKLLLTPGAQEVIQRFVNKKMIEATTQLNKDYPILSILPIQARLYVVNTCKSVKYPNNPTKIALCVDVSQPGLEPYVFKDISFRGFNPADYEIIFLSGTNDND